MDSKEMAQTLLSEFAQLFREGATRHMKDVSGGELGVLGYIHYTGGGLTPSDISREFRISSARVANVLNALERKEYIERRSDREDRRKVRIFATEKGQLRTEDCITAAVEEVRMVMEQLGEEDAADALRLMRRVREVYEKLWGEPTRTDQEVHL